MIPEVARPLSRRRSSPITATPHGQTASPVRFCGAKPRSNGTVSATVDSLIMGATERRMRVAPSPCKGVHYTDDLAF